MIQKEIYQTPLAAGQQWASSWFDNGQSATELLACVSVYSDQPGQLVIYQTDDPENPQMTIPGQGAAGYQGGKIFTNSLAITHLFWKVVYVNGPNAQTTFEIVISASAAGTAAVLLELQKINFQLARSNDESSSRDASFSPLTGSLV